MDRSYASKVVNDALTMGVEEAICQVIHERSQQVRFSNNEITVATELDSVKAEIFVSKGNRSTKFALENVERLEEDLRRAVKFLDTMKENRDHYGIAKGPFEYRRRKCDKAIADTDVVELASLAIEACEAQRLAGVLCAKYQEVDLASPYTETSDERSYIETSVRAFEDGSSGHAVSCSSTLRNFDGVKASAQASDMAKRSKSPVSGKEGKYDIVFTPLCFSTLFAGGLYSLSAFFVDSGISFLMGKMGKDVASPLFSVANDGILEEGIFSAKFDKEGVPTRKTSLISEGVLKSFLHNTSTARKFNTETTANAGIDIPEPQNLVIKEGDRNVEELIGEVQNGLMVTNTWYTRFQNYMTGDFSTIPRDAILRIENGEVAGCVKDIRISDNMLHLLQNISGLGKGTEQIHWWECDYPVFSPYVLVKDVNVTVSTK